MKNMTKTVDVTPTWRALVPLLVALANNPNTQHDAHAELARMADAADKWNAHCKGMR
jgi:hypothetical protein